MAATSGWLTLPTWLREAFKGKRAPERSTSATATAIPPLGEGRIRVQLAGQLLAPPERQARVQALADLTRVTPAHFETLYRQALLNYASYVQQLPASEAHHHAGLGGLLDHGIEATIFALKLRRGHLLPPAAATEVIDAQADLWSYACFTAILLHDIGKPAVDQKVDLFDKHGRKLGRWDPWVGPMQAQNYEARFLRNRTYRLHQRAAPLLARFIVPPEGFRWLTSERDVLTSWLAAITGAPEDAGPLGSIVEEADRLSTAADLTGGLAPQAPTSRVRPLHERLVTGLRYLIDRGQLSLNRPGAAGWLIGDELWLVVKTALDAMRAHLLQEGQSGIPGDNRRLMDELQQRGTLIPNGDRAVWSARVTLGEWQQELTLLRFPVSRFWPDPATRPEACTGMIEPLANADLGEVPQTRRARSPGGIDNMASRALSDRTGSRHEKPATPLETREAVATTVNTVASGAIIEPAPTTSLTTQVTEAPASVKPLDLGQSFLSWLKAGLTSGDLPMNTVNARVHRVREGVLLVSPGIFRDYGNAVQAPWASIQKRFQKLRVHRKTPEGFNIWTYRVIGERRTRELKGILIDDPEKVFGPSLSLSSANPHVVLVQEKKG
ncbi:MAG: MobH family relaxase [Gammaproteobacteria bacterium]